MAETLLFTENLTFTLSNNIAHDALYCVIIDRYQNAIFVTINVFLKMA